MRLVSESALDVLVGIQFAAAALALLVWIRVIHILSSNPIGELGPELIYLRIRDLRQAGYLGFAVVTVELVEYVFPFLADRGWIAMPRDLTLLANTVQSVLVLLASLVVVLVLRRYTQRALDRRIGESMETLAYLEGQRRRRRAAERGEPHDDDE